MSCHFHVQWHGWNTKKTQNFYLVIYHFASRVLTTLANYLISLKDNGILYVTCLSLLSISAPNIDKDRNKICLKCNLNDGNLFSYTTINPFPPIDACWHICNRRLLKTSWQKETLLKTSNVSFCHNVFNFFQ